MNEINIYNRIKGKIDIEKKKVDQLWKIYLGWIVYSVILAIFLPSVIPLGIQLGVVLLPLILPIFFSVKWIIGLYRIAKKYSVFYKRWMNQKSFVNQVRNRSTTRAQQDPDSIKIDNYGLQYIDDIINAYYDDKFKLSNSFYNAINNTTVVEEIKFYEKFKRFKNDMNLYRNSV